jgi:predicted dehydrogenase
MAFRATVVGLGLRGRYWSKTVERTPGWELAAGVDPDETARDRTRSDLGLSKDILFEQLDDALNVPTDVVIVNSPAEFHAAPAHTAIDAGLAVLIEKPMTTTFKEARNLVEAAEGRGVALMVVQNFRYMRAHRTAKRIVSEGRLGTVGAVTAHYYRTPHQMADSLRMAEHSALWGVAIHHLDALRHVLGRDATAVLADESTKPWSDIPRGASLRALLRFEGGIDVTYTASYESRGHEYFGGGQEFYERIVGDRATLHMFHRWLFLCEGRKLPRPIRRGKRPETEEAVILGKLAHALRTGEEPECSGRDNLGTVAIIEACVQSSATGDWVDVPELMSDAS